MASPRAAALALIRMRMKNDARMGAEPPMPETEADLEEVSLLPAALFLFRISSAAGDRYGFGAEAAAPIVRDVFDRHLLAIKPTVTPTPKVIENVAAHNG